jgi:hypothetical protein
MSAGGGVAVAFAGTDATPASEEERTVILLLAYVHLHHGAAHKAETLYAALHVLAPHDAGVAKGLACARLALGKAVAALGVLDGITGPGEPGAVVQLLRARALAQAGQLEDARVAMRAYCAARGATP